VHLRRLSDADDEVLVLAPIGDDDGARIVREAVRREGLRNGLVRRSGATPVQHIRLAADGERRFVGYDEGVLRGFRVGPDERALIARSDILTTAAFGQGLDLFESAIACPSHGLRAVDFTNANDIGEPLAFVERHAASFDIGLFGLGAGDRELIDALEALAVRTGRLLVVTLGADGSIALGGPTRLACPAVPVERVVDTTGAGDAFTAGFVLSYVRDRDVPRALARASAVAGETLGRVGSF
jgi:sugar/nucleoside kinase (ribokinase family)